MRAVRVLTTLVAIAALLPAPSALAQTTDPQDEKPTDRLLEAHENLRHRIDVLEKLIDDVLWNERVGDVAVVEKVRIYGPPLANEPDWCCRTAACTPTSPPTTAASSGS